MKKSIAIVVIALSLCIFAIGGTMAWLFDSKQVSNTFTVGNIAIDLTEPAFVANSKIYPGAVIPKNPTITVKANSEECYVFAMIENNLKIDANSVAALNLSASWTQVDSASGNKIMYKYNSTVALSASDNVLAPLFTNVTIDGAAVTKENISGLDGKTINIKAYAHQVAAQTEVQAIAAAKTHFGM